METVDAQFKKMTETPVNMLVTKLALPTIASMLITNIYNLADAYFVGKINTSASGAIGIVLVVQAIIQAFGFTFGHGSGSNISRKLGAKDNHSANRFASTGFFLSLLSGTVIMILGLIFINPLMRLLGSTETILPYAKDYGLYILLAAPFMSASCVLNNIMRYEGHALFAMIGLTAGGLLNIALDPVFMFVLGLGTAGAGIATALSQVISFSILLFMFLSGRTQSKISVKYISWKFADTKNIFLTGFPSLIRQGLNSISTMALNNSAAVYGDAAVAGMSIVGRVCMFIASIMIGIGQGLQPVAAFNYGAHKFKRVRQSFRFTFIMGEILLCIIAAVGFFAAPHIITLFRNDPEVVEVGTLALKLQCIAMAVQPLGVCANMTFQSIGESKKSSFLAMLRSGLYFLPLIALLPRFIGVTGVQISQPIADALTFVTSLPMVVMYFRRFPKDDENSKSASNNE